jgi:signal transduction histidine kinase/ActR/RegA family two-component response regulator
MSSAAGGADRARPERSSWLPAAVLALGAAAGLLLIAAYQLRERLLVQSTALIHSASEIRRDVAVSHLWLEEYLSGDTVDFQEVLGSLDHADGLAEALLQGGPAGRPRIRIKPIQDAELRRRAAEVQKQIAALRKAARARQEGWRRGEDMGIGSALDEQYDQMFRDLEKGAETLEQGAESRLAADESRARVAFGVLLLGWGAVVVTAAHGLRSRERRQRQAEEALRRSEAQLLQAQKLEAVGRLAGGLAHDINNYITAMTSQCELVQMQAPAGEKGEKISQKMDLVIATGGKVTALIRRLLAFSRQQPVQPEVVDLNGIIEGMRPMLVGLAGELIQLEVLPGQGLWPVEIDPSQVEQVIVNLLVNAREASPDGGLVMLETANCRLDAAALAGNPTARPGDYVLIALSDCGVGIRPEIRDRLFEPFFTTKEGSGARGLGLASVYGIARQNGGHVTVYSEAGQGTTFKVYLPRSAAAVEPGEPAGVEEERREAQGGSETILLVDDNEELRLSARAVLEAIGYRVLAAAGGQEALAVLDRAGGKVDLAICDVVMPGLSGNELVESLRQRDAGLPILFISGYTDKVVLRQGLLAGEVEFLEKPFSVNLLAARVRALLDRRSVAAIP